MSELVRGSVKQTIELLYGLIANPEAVDKFAAFFEKINERTFVMSVTDGRYNDKELGTVVTLTVHDGEGKFELLQGFLPIAVEMFEATGKRFFTDFFEPEFGSVVRVLSDELEQ